GRAAPGPRPADGAARAANWVSGERRESGPVRSGWVSAAVAGEGGAEEAGVADV
ncbi:hypothetical protein E4U42_001180, partial [Claviceps africana]